jgi:hypothetical protein
MQTRCFLNKRCRKRQDRHAKAEATEQVKDTPRPWSYGSWTPTKITTFRYVMPITASN